jgi:hypothetical protein
MKITIKYQLLSSSKSIIRTLSKEEYYDPIEENEDYWHHGIPRFVFLHEYLNINSNRIKWIMLIIKYGKHTRTRISQYLSGDKVLMEHTVDENLDEEIILSTELNKKQWHIIRVLKPKGKKWTTTLNNIVIDKTGKIIDYCKNWKYKQLIQFSNLK